MKRFVIILVGCLQVVFAAVALWVLYDTKASSEHFSRQYTGTPLEFTWRGILFPLALSLTISLSAVLQGLSRRSPRARLAAMFSLLSIGLVMSWSLIFLTVDYKSFFVRSGALQPNEIMGASWPLVVVVALLSLATLLGVIPIVLNCLCTEGGMRDAEPGRADEQWIGA